jgi:uncharacterized short protein YbdD (DUF466 family)
MRALQAVNWLKGAWAWLRRVSGDDAYERYRAHQVLQHPGAPTMSRREFCADAERRKWSGVSRCC